MFLIFLIKNVCLLAFYFTYANMIFIDSVNSSRLVIYFIILASLSLTYFFRNNKKYSKFKYLSFFGFIIAILFSKTAAGGILVLFPFIYMIFLVSNNKNYSKFKYLLFFIFIIAILFSRNIFEVILILIPFICVIFLVIGKQQHYEDYYSFKDLFIKLLIASAFLLIFVILSKKLELFYKTGLQYAILFVISGLYLLRTIRHSEDIITSKKFLVMNLLIVITVCLICILFSTDVILNSVISGVKFVYIKIIIPVIAQVLYIIFTPIGRFLNRAMISKFSEMPKIKESDYIEYTEEADITTFYVLSSIFVSIVFILVIYFLIKWILNRKRKSSNYTEGIIEYTSFLNDDIKKKETKHSFHTNQTRYWYKKFLELCRKKEMYIFKYDNSQTIYNKSSKLFKNHDTDLENIKEIYRKARYGKDVIDKQKIKTIKSSYKSLEKEKTEK